MVKGTGGQEQGQVDRSRDRQTGEGMDGKGKRRT